MKKSIIIIAAVFVVSLITILYAAPGDVEIKLVISAAFVDDFSAGFLAAKPIPLIEAPNPNDPMVPEYTPKEWITEWLRRQALRMYVRGKKTIAEQAVVADPNVIQTVQ